VGEKRVKLERNDGLRKKQRQRRGRGQGSRGQQVWSSRSEREDGEDGEKQGT